MMLYNNTDDDLKAIYEQLKDRYELVLTNTADLDEGFTADCPILVGRAHGQIIELYLDCEMFVLDIIISFNAISKIRISSKKILEDSTEEITKHVKKYLLNNFKHWKRIIKSFPDLKILKNIKK